MDVDPIDPKLDYHLNYNHYPPLGRNAIRLAQMVIDHVAHCPHVDVPDYFHCSHTTADLEGIWVDGEPTIVDILDAWHLWGFVDHEDFNPEDDA